ncbi:hypothetical protein ACFOOM_32525 [Streptomyces echinoruber]|uniref:Helix-turn-helix domain-containing protein n=1 Tax=Streptomyces echinoruber TaxID=68898 RepID=A0A918RZL6_9ACTN|nr:hypothetical protein [Streptomyces echinoruber]GHA17327.1 hypothetical protein GCM10010389_64540 [Streptomyces echinoruber]
MGSPAGAHTADFATSGTLDLEGLVTALRLIAESGSAESLLRRSAPLHVGYAEAARRLNIPEKWLRERISRLPHRKLGKYVCFTDEDLRAISEMHAVRPDHGEQRTSNAPGSPTPLRPSPRSRSRS